MNFLPLIAEILMVGNSLLGDGLPALLQSGLAQRGDSAAEVSAQVLNGASLEDAWNRADEAIGADARRVLADGADTLILTEWPPGASGADSAAAVARWAEAAWKGNPSARLFILETWPARDDDWSDRVAASAGAWQTLVSAADAVRPATAPEVELIPAGQAIRLAVEAAEAGDLPGIDDSEQLFEDAIHPSGKGRYLMTMVAVAALTGQTPEGLPAKLLRQWQSRNAVISDEQAAALQSIAWQAVSAPDAATSTSFPPIENKALSLNLAPVNDWSVSQPFLDLMKTARPWTAHKPDQWEGMDHAALVEGGWLDIDGWPVAIPPGMTGLSTLVLTDLPEDATGLSGHYLLRWRGQGNLALSGRAMAAQPESGGIGFDFTPGEGAVILTLTATDATDPIRDITLVRADRVADHDAGAIFNPDWLARLQGVKRLRFAEWMVANDTLLAEIDFSPKVDDFTWAQGVPMEVMVSLANTLQADPWFTVSHRASDSLVRFDAETVADLLAPGLRAHVEYSNAVWNPAFPQSAYMAEQAEAAWGDAEAGLQFYGKRAAEVATIWAEVFGPEAQDRLVRVIAAPTGVLGAEEAILSAPLATAKGARAPVESFDAYAITGHFSGLLGSDLKLPLLREWLASGAKADPDAPLALALRNAAEELEDGRHSEFREDTLTDLLTRLLPYQAEVAKTHDLTLMMSEGGLALPANPEMTGLFDALVYAPEMGALYAKLRAGWEAISDTPLSVDLDMAAPGATPGATLSAGALRHLGDDNPRWQALAAK